MSFHTSSTLPMNCKDGVVYFFGDTSHESWAGTVDYSDLMTETDIARYIEINRPDLVEQLQGLRFASSDIPLSYYGQRALRRSADARIQSPFISRGNEKHPNVSAFQIEGSPILRSESQEHAARARLKNYIQGMVLNGYVLTLTNGSSACTSLTCAFPGCKTSGFVHLEKHFLNVKWFADFRNSQTPNTAPSVGSYCLCCLEDAFDNESTQREDSLTTLPSRLELLHGVDRKSVLSAAQRLHPVTNLTNNDSRVQQPSFSTTDYKAKHPTNPASAIKRRRFTQTEISTAPKEMRNYENTKHNAEDFKTFTSLNTSTSPTTPMSYEESRQDEEKKQNLGRYDRIGLRREQQHTAPWGNTLPSRTKLGTPYSYCKEHNGRCDLVDSNSEFCVVCLFQSCSPNREYIPTSQEQFYCRRWSDDCGILDLPDPFYQICTAVGKESMSNVLSKETIIEHVTTAAAESNESRMTAPAFDLTDNALGEVDDICTPPMDENANIVAKKSELVARKFGNPSTGLSWGIPINDPAQSTQRLKSSKISDTEAEKALIDVPTLGRMHGDSHDIFSSIEVSSSNHTGLVTSEFYDLAPFINAEGLLPRKLELLEAWKNTRPPSRLLTRIKSLDAFGRFQAVRTELGQVEKEAVSIKLSEVLGDRS